MSFVQTDPRAKLFGPEGATTPGAFGSAEYAKFYETEPQVRSALESTWIARGQNFVVSYSETQPGALLERREQPDEYFLLLPDPGLRLEVTAGRETVTVPGWRMVVMPPGPSTLRVLEGGRVVRILSDRAVDLAGAAVNAASYAVAKPKVAPLEAWPEPPDGYRVRVYDLEVEPDPGRFGRIWRSTNLMVNFTEPRQGPRDVTRMSPHAHPDFEQGSLCLSGSFVHHIRWPWGTDMRHWRPDEHEICAGPSLAVIPPQSVHTSQQVSQGINQLVDIFAPPRHDFSNQEGWVLNASEYPLPDGRG